MKLRPIVATPERPKCSGQVSFRTDDLYASEQGRIALGPRAGARVCAVRGEPRAVPKMSRSVTRSIALVASTLMLLGGCATMRASGHADGPGAASTPKISAELAEMASQPAPAPDSTVKSANPALRMIDDRVVIDAVASGDVDALKADLEALGMREAVAFGRIVSGQLPVSAIAALNGLATLQFARPAYPAAHPAR